MNRISAKLRQLVAAGLVLCWLLPVAAWGEEGWQAEFEATCAKTTDAMELSVQELTQLLERCSRLKKLIEAQDDSVRRVYLKRLSLCSNLYAYVLEYKKGGQAAP
jgi:hypothetical protein